MPFALRKKNSFVLPEGESDPQKVVQIIRYPYIELKPFEHLIKGGIEYEAVETKDRPTLFPHIEGAQTMQRYIAQRYANLPCSAFHQLEIVEVAIKALRIVE